MISLAGFCDRNQFETFGAGFEVQARQFLFRPPSLESCRASIRPGFALGEAGGRSTPQDSGPWL
jgi:hypothetical protein